MTTNQEQNRSVDSAEACMVASGNSVPEQDEEVPNLQQIYRQMQAVQARLERKEKELLNMRAERDALLVRKERYGSTIRVVSHVGSCDSGEEVGSKEFLDSKPPEFKRKPEGFSGLNKRFKGGSSKGKDEEKTAAWCVRCKSRHTGPCSAATIRCNKCGSVGHLIKDCVDVERCYECKESGHRISYCPKRRTNEKKTAAWCDRCRSRHTGPCTANTLRCNKCGNTGHMFKDCADVARCFKCKEPGHRVAECPKKDADEEKNDRPKRLKLVCSGLPLTRFRETM